MVFIIVIATSKKTPTTARLSGSSSATAASKEGNEAWNHNDWHGQDYGEDYLAMGIFL